MNMNARESRKAASFAVSLVLIVLMCIFFTSMAKADSSAAAGAYSGSQSSAGSQAGAAAIGNQAGSYSGINIGGGSGSSGGPAIGSTLNYSVNSKVEAADLSDAVPSMWAPGLGGGGSNPCVVSGSGAAVGSGFGISIGGSWNDGECQIRESLRVLGGQLNGKSREAQVLQKNIACQSDIMRMALNQTARETGQAAMRCSSVFGDDTTAPRTTQRRPAAPSAAPARTSYVDAVANCRRVPDTQYASCMKKARSLL